MKFKIDIDAFIKRYKTRVIMEGILFVVIAVTVNWLNLDNSWTTLLLIFVGGYALVEIALYKSSKNTTANYQITLAEDYLFFSGKNFAKKLDYADIKIIEVRQKQQQVVKFTISTPYVSALKIEGFIDMNALYLGLKEKIEQGTK